MAMPYAYFEEQNQTEQSSRAEKTNGQRAVSAHSQAATAAKLEPTESDRLSVPSTRGRSNVATKAKAEEEAAERRNKRTEKLAELEARRDNLIDRLDMGAVRIQEARVEGKEVSSWEDFWLQLLRSYEQVCDEVRDLVAQE